MKDQRLSVGGIDLHDLPDINLVITALVATVGPAFQNGKRILDHRRAAITRPPVDIAELVVGGPCELHAKVLLVAGENVDGKTRMGAKGAEAGRCQGNAPQDERRLQRYRIE